MICQKRKEGKWGFTLIELLIVVAIIAILAAIAVPNFLEAQTRAKVSRVKADMRSLMTAMESYMVDYNTYPNYWEREAYNSDVRGHGPSAGRVLSTPVSYITSGKIRDPFKQGGSGDYARADQIWLNIYAGSTISKSQGHWPKTCYALQSFGPDRTDNTSMGGFPFNRTTANTGHWVGQYDPTNGTKSWGEISRGMPKLPKVWVIDTGSSLDVTDDPFAY